MDSLFLLNLKGHALRKATKGNVPLSHCSASLYFSHTLTQTLYEEQVSLHTLRSFFNQLQQHQPSLLSLVYSLLKTHFPRNQLTPPPEKPETNSVDSGVQGSISKNGEETRLLLCS